MPKELPDRQIQVEILKLDIYKTRQELLSHHKTYENVITQIGAWLETNVLTVTKEQKDNLDFHIDKAAEILSRVNALLIHFDSPNIDMNYVTQSFANLTQARNEFRTLAIEIVNKSN